MAALSGTILASRIVPSDSADAYATHDADYGRGGYRSVADIAERDAITEPRRKLGMKVFVNSEQKEYQLIGGIENINWTEVASGSGSGASTLSGLTDTEIATPVNGQALLYDEAGQKWVNGDVGYGGALTIADATDTTITAPTAGQVLTYDDVSGTWINADAPTGGSTDLTNYYTKDETYSKDEVDGVLSTATINGLIPASANITLVTMTQMNGNAYEYVIPANAWVTIPYNFKHKDDLNQYDPATGKVTIAESAYYLINAKIEPYGGNSMNAWTYYSITRNNTSAGDFINALYYDSELTTAPLGRDVTIPVYLLAGDTIQVNVKTAHSNPALRTGDDKEYSFGQANFLSVVKLTGVATNVTYTGLNAYELAVQEGFVGTLNDWLLSINGDDGLSAYDVWLGLGNTGTEQEFLDSLKGDAGQGVPSGGTAGQILAKIDATDYNTQWIDAPTGGGSAEYPDMTGNAGKVLGTDGTNVRWVDNGDAVVLNMRYAGVSLYISASPGGVGANTNWLTNWYSNNTMDISQKVSDSRLLLKAGRTYRIIGGIESSTGTTTSGITTKLYSAKVSDGVFTEVEGGYSYNVPVSNTSHIVRNHKADCYIKTYEDMWVECRVDANSAGTVTNFASDYMITEYLNVTGEGAITLPPVTNQSGKFLSNNGTDIEWVKPEFNGLSELPQYKLGEEVLTSERWHNGKPIYRVTVDCGAVPNNTAKTIAIPSYDANNEYWIDMSSSYLKAGSGSIFPMMYFSSTTTQMMCQLTGGNIWIDADNSAFAGGRVYVTVKYTKSTDTASSPVALVGGMGLSELPAYKLDKEVLTSRRWIDGKPIYQKVINFGALPNNTTKSVAHGVVGAGRIWIDKSASIVTFSTSSYAVDGVFGVLNAQWNSKVTTTTVDIQTYSDRTTGSAVIVLEYTKTADTANSPVKLVGSQYNISSNEYVLPYTRNGKTVYGMEVDFGTLPNATTKSVAIPNYNSSYKYIISSDSYAYDPVNKSTRPLPSPHATNLIDVSLSNGLIYITCSGNRSAFTESKVVLHYTKD